MEIEYLVLIVSKGEVRMDLIKVTGVMEWPTPGTKCEVQPFLRFTNFYWSFIQDFSDHARAHLDLTKKGVDWK